MSQMGISFETNDNEQTIALKRQIYSLQAQIKRKDDYAIQLSGGNLIKSGIVDLYPGEQHDFLLSILKQVKDRCHPDSRAFQIIDSILAQNKPVGRGKEILNELERIFRKGYPTSVSDINDLKAIGFTYTPSRKHPKLRFYNDYMFVLPSTPSDHYYGASNCLAEISKCIAMYQKV